MAFDHRRPDSSTRRTSDEPTPSPGKRTLTEGLPAPGSHASGGSADPAQRTAAATTAPGGDPATSLERAFGKPVQARMAMTPPGNAPGATATGGAPLADHVRAPMEASFGADFRGVRVHQGGNATALGAVAYAQGEDLHFAPGAYDPGSTAGRELIGHELAHVVQQREGRVAAPQGKGDPINADPALEAEADAHGARAARGEPAGNAATSVARAPGAVVQRKVELGDAKDPTTDDILRALAELGVLGDADAIYAKVLRGKPNAMVQESGIKNLDVDNRAVQEQAIDAWRVGPGTHKYERSRPDGERLLEDAFNYHLHTKHDWRNIGVAEYMTGDATALGLAPLVDPNLSVEILTGQQKKGEDRGPSFIGKDGELPPYFSGAQQGGHITLSDTDNRDDFKGTQDRYARTFNPYVNKNVAPWNKETWEATRVLGEAYQDPEKRALVRSKLQLGSSKSDEAAKRQIETYKRTKLDGKVQDRPCVFLWGRTSGQKGGAHEELDSHAQMLIQLAQKIRDDFPGHMIILVGDPVITLEDLKGAGIANQVMDLGAFWNDDDYGQYMKDRNAQRYLFQLFDQQNQAVSIGMRSGSLEGMALLGLRVVFLDDQGNQAEGRMEFWSGDSARDRGKLVRDGGDRETLDGHEVDHQGPMPTYKRVGTLLTLGDQVDARAKSLRDGRALVNELLTGDDQAGHPMCSGTGNPLGVGMLVGTFGAKYDATLMTGAMPGDPGLARGFSVDLDRFTDLVNHSNYQGDPARNQGSAFGSTVQDVSTMEDALRKDLGEDTDGKAALQALGELRGMTDVSNVALVGEQEGKSAGWLFGSLLTKARARTELTSKDAQDFVKRYQQSKKNVLGKSTVPKFPQARVTGVQTGIDTLERSNVLQPDELNQVSHLTRFLSEQRT